MSLGVNFGKFTETATEIAPADRRCHRRGDDSAAARLRMEEHLDTGSRIMKDALLRGQLAGVGL